MKSSEKFPDKQMVPFKLDKTQVGTQMGTKKTFFEKKIWIFSFGKCRIVPKNVKRGPFGIY